MVTNSHLANRLDPASAALAVIDVQNDFCDPNGSMARSGLDVGPAGDAVKRLAELIGTARECGVPVIFVRTEHDDRVDSAEWSRRLETGRGRTPPPPGVNCSTGSWGAEFFGVEPLSGEPVVVKHRYSAFSAEAFADTLQTLRRRSVLFAGVATHICVESTLRDAVDRDLLVMVVSDCCAAYEHEDHEASIVRIDRSFGPAISSAEAMSGWHSLAGTKERA